MSSADVEREALAAVDRYLVALNARNTEAIRDFRTPVRIADLFGKKS